MWGALDVEISEYEPVKRNITLDGEPLDNVTHLTFYDGELILL